MSLARITKEIGAAGGRSLLIGGAVIDSIMGRPIKDWDVEVYGLSIVQVCKVLDDLGLKYDAVGASFGVIKTKSNGLDVDLSVPRRDNRIGKGHLGFEVEFDPEMTPEEAGRRRDLTINSMYQDMETGEIIDPFDGLEDLKNGVIRATDPDTFVEDPLRVLRVMQLLPRKGRVVDAGTTQLCASMVEEFDSLAKERVFEEFNKLLLKAEAPSLGLQFLRDCGWICHFPELEGLVGCPQNPNHHPEGDVWEHTKRVVDLSASYKNNLPEGWRLAYMYGAMLHDVGKPATTRADLTSYGHAEEGAPLAERFMRRITNDSTLINRVVSIVRLHMRTGELHRSNAKRGAWMRLHNLLRLDVLAWVSRADSLSRYGDRGQKHGPQEAALGHFSDFGEAPIPHVVMGRHLIERGMSPGPEMGRLIKKCYALQVEHQLDDVDQILRLAAEED